MMQLVIASSLLLVAVAGKDFGVQRDHDAVLRQLIRELTADSVRCHLRRRLCAGARSSVYTAAASVPSNRI